MIAETVFKNIVNERRMVTPGREFGQGSNKPLSLYLSLSLYLYLYLSLSFSLSWVLSLSCKEAGRSGGLILMKTTWKCWLKSILMMIVLSWMEAGRSRVFFWKLTECYWVFLHNNNWLKTWSSFSEKTTFQFLSQVNASPWSRFVFVSLKRVKNSWLT